MCLRGNASRARPSGGHLGRSVRRLALAACLTPLPLLADSADITTVKRQVAADYAALAYASYQDALAGARALAESVDAFVAGPTEHSLHRARQAWIDSRVPY